MEKLGLVARCQWGTTWDHYGFHITSGYELPVFKAFLSREYASAIVGILSGMRHIFLQFSLYMNDLYGPTKSSSQRQRDSNDRVFQDFKPRLFGGSSHDL